jgi:hypothetical protein
MLPVKQIGREVLTALSLACNNLAKTPRTASAFCPETDNDEKVSVALPLIFAILLLNQQGIMESESNILLLK